MNLLKKEFPGVSHVILPVIHVESASQAIYNAAIAKHSGCDGVFLINHSVSDSTLFEVHQLLTKEIPGLWTGVNSLDTCPKDLFCLLPDSILGLWTDSAEIDERTDQQPAADEIQQARACSKWRGLYFGGVAFKYQRTVDDLSGAVRVAARYVDVVTTSGPGTGEAASVEKIRTMKDALGDFPLAIASGLTPQNVRNYLEAADCFLVATGISSSWTEFDPPSVVDFVQTVRSGAPSVRK